MAAEPGAGEQYMHSVYRNAKREETEWDAAQRRLGNLPPLPPEFEPEAWSPAAEPCSAHRVVDAASLAGASEARAAAAEDATCDDRALEALRRRRLSELRADAARPRFGALLPLRRDAFVREVTDASMQCDVAVLLQREALPACVAAREALEAVAAAHPRLKCCAITAVEAVGGHYPDAQLPTLLLYRAGDVALTLAGPAWAVGGGRGITPQALAAALNEAPGGRACRSAAEEAEADERFAAEAEERRARAAEARAKAQEAREAAEEDESSDFSDD
jgi:hypothetical protein